MAPADVGLGGLVGERLLLALLQLHLVEPRLEPLHGERPVLVLGALLLREDHDVGRLVQDADRGLRAVDRLPARARRAREADVDVGRIDLDVDRIVDHRIDGHRRERGVPAGIGIERRDPHESMHPALGLQPAVGVLARDLQRRRLDPGLLARAFVDELDLVAPPLGPAHVHAEQHRRPVLAFGAAGAGVNLEIGVVGVRLARQQRLDAQPLGLVIEPLERRLALAHAGVVALRLAELDQRQAVVELLLHPLHARDRGLERLALAHHLLRLRLVAPECRVLGLAVQLREPVLRGLPVKETSSGGPAPP